MSVLYDLLVQMAPILLGIAFMLAINSLKLGQSRIRIRASPYVASEAVNGKPYIAETDLDSSEFEREARDRLIEKGCMGGDDFDGKVRDLAFDRLGIIECGRLNQLNELSAKNSQGILSVFAGDRRELLRHVLHFSPDSGVLLSYLDRYKVDVFGA